MKKRIFSFLLALTMVTALLPGVSAAQDAPVKSLKVLAIGNSYSMDATVYLYDIAKAYGAEEVVIGNLYIGGCSLATHWKNAQNNAPDYTYYKTDSSTWTTQKNTTMLTGIQDEDWDIITIQQASQDSGYPSSYAPLGDLTNYVNQNKTNPNAKLVWHMTWSYQNSYTGKTEFANRYNSDQKFMHECIVNSIRARVTTRPEISGVIPSGTAIQNARASSLGDKLNRDGTHLNTIGRVIAAHTWYCALTGSRPNAANYIQVADSFDLSSKKPKTPGMTLTQEQQDIIQQAVANALDDPYMGAPDLYTFEAGATAYIPSAPVAGQLALGYVFGSDTVADGSLRAVLFPDDALTKKNDNQYAGQFWYLDGDKVTNVADTSKCNGKFGLHDTITAADATSITLDNGTHKDAASCTLGSIGSCGSEGRTGECAATPTLDPKFAITDLRAAVVSGTESAVTTLDAVKALCDAGKAVVNTYAPNGAVRSLIVLDHTLTVQAAPSENGSITLSTGGAGAADGSMVYANVGTTVTVVPSPNEGYKFSKVSVDGETIAAKTFVVSGEHTVSGVFAERNKVYYTIEPLLKETPTEAYVLYALGQTPGTKTTITSASSSGASQLAHHFWEEIDGSLKRFAGPWVAYGTRYIFGYHDVITELDEAAGTVTLGSPSKTHRGKSTCPYTKAKGWVLNGVFDESCGAEDDRGYECAAELNLSKELVLIDLRGEVLAGTIPAVTTLAEVKALCDAEKAVVNTYVGDGTKSGGTVDAFILLDLTPFQTRAEFVQSLYEQAGKPAVSGEITFIDVTADNEYAAAINWATQTGLVAGYGDGTFGTEDKLTVEQLAVLLWKQAGKPAAAAAPESIKCSVWASEALGWCAANGILNNVSCTDATAAAASIQSAQMLANCKK